MPSDADQVTLPHRDEAELQAARRIDWEDPADAHAGAYPSAGTEPVDPF
jgi:hypothetical protein